MLTSRKFLCGLGLIFCIIYINCNTNTNTNNSGNSVNKAVYPLPSPHYLQQTLPHVYKYTENAETTLKDLLALYAYQINNADSLITTKKELINLFELRQNKILPKLQEQVFEPLLNEDPEALQNEESHYFFNELNEIGIRGVFAEGMFIGLGEAPMLENKLQKLAPEDFRLSIEFAQAQTEAIGGEYPFLNLDGEINSVIAGEQLLFNHAKSKYARNIESQFRFSLRVLTDVHALTGKYDQGYITHDLAFEHYPYEISMEQIKQFAVKHPQSRYAKVLANIAENPSEMELDADEPKPVYLVLINRFKPQIQPDESSASAHLCPDAEKELYRYLDNGTDVCHTLLIYDKNEPTCALVYRYYPNAEKAGNALQNWKGKMPDVPAQIVKLRYNNKLERWEIQSN